MIRYVETLYGKKLLFHTGNSAIEISGTLSPWEKKLGPGFFRVHSSFLVNMKEVRSIGHSVVTLSGGEELPISRYRKKEFQNALMRFASDEQV